MDLNNDIVYFIGCSFTAGNSLPDETGDRYSTLLGNIWNKTVINDAIGGGSNDYIFHQTMRGILEHKPKTAIIQWTQSSRFELYTREEFWNSRNMVLQINANFTERDPNKFIDEYYKMWWDEEHSFKKWTLDTIALQMFLKQMGINYYMMNAFGTQELYDKYPMSEFEYIDKDRYLEWPDDTFLNWAGNFPKMPDGHPGPDAHKHVANKISEIVKF